MTEKIFSVRKRILRWEPHPAAQTHYPGAGANRRFRDRLKPEIERLGALIGRDLSHWLEVREGRVG